MTPRHRLPGGRPARRALGAVLGLAIVGAVAAIVVIEVGGGQPQRVVEVIGRPSTPPTSDSPHGTVTTEARVPTTLGPRAHPSVQPTTTSVTAPTTSTTQPGQAGSPPGSSSNPGLLYLPSGERYTLPAGIVPRAPVNGVVPVTYSDENQLVEVRLGQLISVTLDAMDGVGWFPPEAGPSLKIVSSNGPTSSTGTFHALVRAVQLGPSGIDVEAICSGNAACSVWIADVLVVS